MSQRIVTADDIVVIREAVGEARKLYGYLLHEAIEAGWIMYFASSAARAGFHVDVIGVAVSAAGRAVRVLAHAQRVDDAGSAIEEIVRATPTPTDEAVAAVLMRAAILARACEMAIEEL